MYVALQKWHNENQFIPAMMEKDTQKIIKYACADSCTTTMTVLVNWHVSLRYTYTTSVVRCLVISANKQNLIKAYELRVNYLQCE